MGFGYTHRPRAQQLEATENLAARNSPGSAWREMVQALPGVEPYGREPNAPLNGVCTHPKRMLGKHDNTIMR